MHQPRHCTQKTNIVHLSVQRADGEVLSRVIQLLEVAAESDFTHYIESEVGCPLGNVDALILAFE